MRPFVIIPSPNHQGEQALLTENLDLPLDCNARGCTRDIKEACTCTTPFPQLHYITGPPYERNSNLLPSGAKTAIVSMAWHGRIIIAYSIRPLSTLHVDLHR